MEETVYAVDFKYNKTSKDYTINGLLYGTKLASTFEYQVVITPEEGDAITSNWAEVKVLDATTAVEATEVSLSNELAYVTNKEMGVQIVDADNKPACKNTEDVKLKDYIDGVKLSKIDSVLTGTNKDLAYELRTSNKDVLVFDSNASKIATTEIVKVEGLKVDEATISLVKIEGAKETIVAKLNVTVENSVKLVTEVKFNDKVEAVTVGNTDRASLITAVADATNLDEKHIESVEYVVATQQVIVTIKATYGGGEYKLAVKDTTAPIVSKLTVNDTEITVSNNAIDLSIYYYC